MHIHKTILTVLGVVLTAVGILGFFNNPVLGIFAVNTLHNLVHLVTGVGALIVLANEDWHMWFARLFGLVYAVVAVAGFLSDDGMVMGMVMNTADHYLHVFLALVFLWIGFGPVPQQRRA